MAVPPLLEAISCGLRGSAGCPACALVPEPTPRLVPAFHALCARHALTLMPANPVRKVTTRTRRIAGRAARANELEGPRVAGTQQVISSPLRGAIADHARDTWCRCTVEPAVGVPVVSLAS